MRNYKNLSLFPILNKLAPMYVGLFVLFIYTLTLSPTINSFDSAEFVTGAYSLGIVHAPGYPLYLILAHIATLIPYVTVPVAVNFLSALFAALCVVIVYLTSYHLTKSLFWSTVSGLMLAFSNLFWGRAVIAEVYSLNGLLVATLFLLYTLYSDTRSNNTLAAIFFVAGLSLTHHTSVILILPWLFLSLTSELPQNIKKTKLITAAILFILPLSLYSYFPIRDSANPPLNYIRDYFNLIDLSSIRGIYWMFSGQMFHNEMLGRSFQEWFVQFFRLLADVWLNYFGVGLILAIFALIHYLKHKKRMGFVVMASVLSILVFFSGYDVVDNREMIIPAMVLLAPFIAEGGAMLTEQINNKQTKFSNGTMYILMSIAVLAMLLANWVSVDRSSDWSAYQYSDAVLKEAEPNSLIITQWTAATPLEYMQIVEGRRSDIWIFDRGLFSLGIRALYSNCLQTDTLEYCSTSRDQALKNFIDHQLPLRPIYITEDDPILNSDYCLIGMQYLYRILPLQACELKQEMDENPNY